MMLGTCEHVPCKVNVARIASYLDMLASVLQMRSEVIVWVKREAAVIASARLGTLLIDVAQHSGNVVPADWVSCLLFLVRSKFDCARVRFHEVFDELFGRFKLIVGLVVCLTFEARERSSWRPWNHLACFHLFFFVSEAAGCFSLTQIQLAKAANNTIFACLACLELQRNFSTDSALKHHLNSVFPLLYFLIILLFVCFEV